MGARYLKAEEEAIRELYPSARRFEILSRIPNRTWQEIYAKAGRMGVSRTGIAKGNSIREGQINSESAYTFSEIRLFDRMYPTVTHAELLKAFPNRTLIALQARAQRLHLHRTKEARARQMKIGREEVKKEK